MLVLLPPHRRTFKINPVLILIVLLAALTGCDQQAAFDRLVPKEESEFAKRHLAQLAGKDFEQVEARLDKTLIAADTREKLEALSRLFPAVAPKEITTIGAHTNTVNGSTTYNLTYEYEYPSSWLVASVYMQRTGTGLTVLGTRVSPVEKSLKVTNEFTLGNKSALHYLVLAMTVCIPIFIAYALVICFRTPLPKRKWLWLIFVSLGFVQVSLNWTDGNLNVQPVSVLLFGAGFSKASAYAPAILTFGFPLGAMVFLYRRRLNTRLAAPQTQES